MKEVGLKQENLGVLPYDNISTALRDPCQNALFLNSRKGWGSGSFLIKERNRRRLASLQGVLVRRFPNNEAMCSGVCGEKLSLHKDFGKILGKFGKKLEFSRILLDKSGVCVYNSGN